MLWAGRHIEYQKGISGVREETEQVEDNLGCICTLSQLGKHQAFHFMSKNITKQSIHTDSIQSLPAYASIQRNKSYSLMKTRKPHRTSLTDWWGLLLKESTRKLPKIVGQPHYRSAGFVCCFGCFFSPPIIKIPPAMYQLLSLKAFWISSGHSTWPYSHL